MDDDDSYGSAHNKYDLPDSDKLSVELDDVVDDDDEPIDVEAIKEGPEEDEETKN
jgi:hypothetical protein